MYYNGLRGSIKQVSKSRNTLTVETDDGRLVNLHRRKVTIARKEVRGFAINLGYAITIHKSQGMTLEGANIDPEVFEAGQLYVALSRVKCASGVHLIKPIDPKSIKVNKKAIEFDSFIRERSQEFLEAKSS